MRRHIYEGPDCTPKGELLNSYFCRWVQKAVLFLSSSLTGIAQKPEAKSSVLKNNELRDPGTCIPLYMDMDMNRNEDTDR